MPTVPSRIASRQHPVVKACRQAAADPDGPDGVLLDGPHLVRDALAAGLPIQTVLVSTDFLAQAGPGDRAVIDAAGAAGAAIHEASASVLASASPVRTSSGIVALANWTAAAVPAAFQPAPALTIGLVDVQDPGNVGAVVRSADALGATGVIALDSTSHPGNWKALRGAMGSTFRLPVARGRGDAALASARAAGLAILATVAAGAMAVEEIDLARPTLVLLGNEGAGLPSDMLGAADARIAVPMRPGVESLNVAVTAALVLYEARRQRR